MKILMVIAGVMLIAGVVLADIVLGALGFVSLASAAAYLLDRRANGVPVTKKWIKPGGAVEGMCHCVPLSLLIALIVWFIAPWVFTAPLPFSLSSLVAAGVVFGAGVALVNSVIDAREDEKFFARVANTPRPIDRPESSEIVMPKDKYLQEVLTDVAGTQPDYARALAKMAVEREQSLELRSLLRRPFAIVTGTALLVVLAVVAATYALGEQSKGALYVQVTAGCVIWLVGCWAVLRGRTS